MHSVELKDAFPFLDPNVTRIVLEHNMRLYAESMRCMQEVTIAFFFPWAFLFPSPKPT